MDLAKLGKKLRNELMRNPKKSAILGVICLVALYFWAPLLRGWLPGGKTAKQAKVAAATPVAAPLAAEMPTPEASKANARAEAAFRWDKVVKQRAQDPLMSPASLAGDLRNPFAPTEDLLRALAPQEENETARESKRPVEKPTVEQTPQALGLALKGTVVGRRGRSAQINGRTFAEGAIISVGGPSAGVTAGEDVESPAIEFTLTSVQSDHVVLSRGEKSYTLEFPRGGLPGGDWIVRDEVPIGNR